MLHGVAIAAIIIGSLVGFLTLIAIPVIIIAIFFRNRIKDYFLNQAKLWIGQRVEQGVDQAIEQGKEAVGALAKGKLSEIADSVIGQQAGKVSESINTLKDQFKKASSISVSDFHKHLSPEAREKLNLFDNSINSYKQCVDNCKKEALKHKDNIINEKLAGVDLSNVQVKVGPDLVKLMKKSSNLKSYSEVHLNIAAVAINTCIEDLFNKIQKSMPFIDEGRKPNELGGEFSVGGISIIIHNILKGTIKDLGEDKLKTFSNDVVDFMLNELRICDVVNSDPGKSVSQAKFGEFMQEASNMFDKIGSLTHLVAGYQNSEREKKEFEQKIANSGKDINL